jgi:hypothetical protein
MRAGCAAIFYALRKTFITAIFGNGSQKVGLTRISHKDRRERPESAVNVGLQRQKARRHIEIFRGRFLTLYPRRHGAFRPCSRSLVRNAG